MTPTVDEMLEAIAKAWGYVELWQPCRAEGRWAVRDETDELFSRYSSKIEWGQTPTEAVQAAYDSLGDEHKQGRR